MDTRIDVQGRGTCLYGSGVEILELKIEGIYEWISMDIMMLEENWQRTSGKRKRRVGIVL